MIEQLTDPDMYRKYPHGKQVCECSLAPSDMRHEESAFITAVVMKDHEQRLTEKFKSMIEQELREPLSGVHEHAVHILLDSLSDSISRARDTIEAIKPCVSSVTKSDTSAQHFRTYGVTPQVIDRKVTLNFNHAEDFEDLSQLVKDYNTAQRM